MSDLVIERRVYVDGVLTDATSVVLSDSTGAWGVRRQDTGAVVVADGTAMTHSATGVYSYTITGAVAGVTYEYAVEVVLDGATYRVEDEITAPEAAGSSGDGSPSGTTYTYLQLKTAVEHALASAPDDRISSGLIVNRAIEYLCRYHTWSWRTVIGNLTLTSGQPYIALPADFGELLQVSNGTTAFTTIKPVAPAELLRVRRNTYSTTSTLVYMLSISAAASDTAAPLHRLEIAPTPTATATGGLAYAYLKSIPTYAITGSDDDAKVPAIPTGQQDTLYALCRAFAISTEEQQAGHDWELAKELLERDKAADLRAGRPAAGIPEQSSDGQLTFGELKAEVDLIAGRDIVQHTSAGRIVNRAIDYLATCHNWGWRLETALLDLTADQEYVDLPTDFADLVEVYPAAALSMTEFRPLTTRELLALRANTISDSTFVGYCVRPKDQAAGATARINWQLDVAPTPAATTEDAFYVVYRKVISTFASTGTADDNKVPAVGIGMQSCLVQLVRAFACQALLPERFNAEWALAQELLATARKHDSETTQPVRMGRMRNSYVEDYLEDSVGWRPHDVIRMASDP